MIWLILAILSYALNAVVSITDKFILSSKIKKPLAYTFFVGILSGVSFLIWPFYFSFLPFKVVLLALCAGAGFCAAIYFLYSAMFKSEVSRVVSVVNGVSPVIVLILSYFFLNERLSDFWFVAFIFLFLGSVILMLEEGVKIFDFKIKKTVFIQSLLAAGFFALTFFLTKAVFLESTFFNGFIWIRLGTFLTALSFLIFPSGRAAVLGGVSNTSKRVSLFFISNKVLSAFAFLILNYAITLGSVTIINALQGVQYAFIFILTLVIYIFKPGFSHESFSLTAILQKITGIMLISAGVALLFIF